MFERFEKKLIFTGKNLDSCPACKEVRGMHNTCRNRACSAQLGSKNFTN